MACILHGSTRITLWVRAELLSSKDASGALAKGCGLNRVTVAKLRARANTADVLMGRRVPVSTMLTTAVEAMIVEFRRPTLLTLDDMLGCLRDNIPKHDPCARR